MARNCQLTDKNGLQVFPRTYAKNVIMSNGKSLEDMIYEILKGSHIVFEPYQLQGATRYSLGGVIVGKGLEIDENNVLSVSDIDSIGAYPYSESIEENVSANVKFLNYESEVEVC